MKECVVGLTAEHQKRKKILLGLNFYGMDYAKNSGGPILGSHFVDLLKRHGGKLKWDDLSAEHYYEYTLS